MQTEERIVFGKNIQTIMNQQGCTIQRVALDCGYDRESLSALLLGNKNFKLATAVKLARYFDVSIFLLFSRSFESQAHLKEFPFVEADYMEVLRRNFRNTAAKQAAVELDSPTVSQIMNGRRNNLTVDTLHLFAKGAARPLSELLITEADKTIERRLKEEEE